MMSGAEVIKKMRINLCMEQEEFGKALGISKSAVCNYERGLRTPRLPIIKKMKELAQKNKMKISVEDFLND